MHKLRAYILSHFFKLFISIFLPLLAVASIIILIKIATVTAIVKLDAMDMASLYFYILPQVVVFTLPISFFVAGILTLDRFSNENELIVLFALGVKPTKILGILFWPALWLTGVMLTTSLLLVPHAQQLYDNYVAYKRTTATLNITASEFGQRYANWMLFIEEELPDKTYKNVALYKPKTEDQKEFFSIANSAHFSHDNKRLQFKLENGKTFAYDEKSMSQVSFAKMQINDTSLLRQLSYQDSKSFWDRRYGNVTIRNMFIISVMMSLLPLLGLSLMLTIGTQNKRHQKSYTFSFIFIAVIVYFMLFIPFLDQFGLKIFYYVVPVWLIGTTLLFYLKILRRY